MYTGGLEKIMWTLITMEVNNICVHYNEKQMIIFYLAVKKNSGWKQNDRNHQTLRRIVSKQHKITDATWQQTSVFTLIPQKPTTDNFIKLHARKICNY